MPLYMFYVKEMICFMGSWLWSCFASHEVIKNKIDHSLKMEDMKFDMFKMGNV
jgi:hypothetical protein